MKCFKNLILENGLVLELDKYIYSIPYFKLYYNLDDIQAEFYSISGEIPIQEINSDYDTIIFEYYPYPEKKLKGIYFLKDFISNNPDKENLPSNIILNKDGSFNQIKYFKNGVYHRDNDLPAIYEIHNNKIHNQFYFKNGKEYNPIYFRYLY
jgi:hypothetical protein